MITGTIIKCSREAESHGGPLRRDENGKWVCQECWAREHGIERTPARGRPVLCPRCGATLMTRFRGGKVSISSMSMKGGKAILKCDCGYEKTIKNPFGGPRDRNEAARQRLRHEAARKNYEAPHTSKE